MTLRRALYDVVADGGVIGSYPMRGVQAVNGGVVLRWQWLLLQDFAPLGMGGVFTIGWASKLNAIGGGNPDGFSAAPYVVSGSGESIGNPVHFDPTEPFLITISGADFTAGSLEMFIEMPEA
jgi:hypothetical protein